MIFNISWPPNERKRKGIKKAEETRGGGDREIIKERLRERAREERGKTTDRGIKIDRETEGRN